MSVRTFEKGEIVFKEMSLGHSMYHILDGSALVYASYGEEQEKKLTELTVGSNFGEMAILEAWPRSATVVAGENGLTCREIVSEELSAYFKEDPSQVKDIMLKMGERLAELTADYEEAANVLHSLEQGSDEKKESSFKAKLKKLTRFAKKNPYEEALSKESAEKRRERTRELSDESVRELTLKNGEIIFRQGEGGSYIYYVVSGSVGIFTDYGMEKQKRLTRLAAGDFFGEIGMLARVPRSTTAVAMDENTKLDAIGEEDLDGLFQKSPSTVLLMMRHLSNRIRTLTSDYLDTCRKISEYTEDHSFGE